MVDMLAMDVPIGTTFIYKHILAYLPEDRKALVCKLNSVAKMKTVNMAAYAVLNCKYTKKVTQMTPYKKTITRKGQKIFYFIRLVKQNTLKPFSVSLIVVTTKARVFYILTLIATLPPDGVCVQKAW